MRVVTHHRPADPQRFLADAAEALRTLSAAPGFMAGEIGRSPDDTSELILTTRWADVGSMRRGMGSFDAKVALAPVLVSAADEPSVFEVLVDATPGVLVRSESGRADGDAGRPF